MYLMLPQKKWIAFGVQSEGIMYPNQALQYECLREAQPHHEFQF